MPSKNLKFDVHKFLANIGEEMVGTTRSRLSFFMNRFRRLGFIEYKGELEVHSSLLNVVLRDSPDHRACYSACRGGFHLSPLSGSLN
jgi:hypothetical protein